MSKEAITTTVTIFLAVIGLAVVAVLVSSKGKTTGVLSAGGSAFQTIICVALKPVTGGPCGSAISTGITYGGIVPG